LAALLTLAMIRRGGLMKVIEVHLMCVDAGPTREFVDAAAFLAE
jgi:hypothetical protein